MRCEIDLNYIPTHVNPIPFNPVNYSGVNMKKIVFFKRVNQYWVVCKEKSDKWRAQMMINGSRVLIGHYNSSNGAGVAAGKAHAPTMLSVIFLVVYCTYMFFIFSHACILQIIIHKESPGTTIGAIKKILSILLYSSCDGGKFVTGVQRGGLAL
jgi:hypothetical protein